MTFFAVGYMLIWLLLLGYTNLDKGSIRKLEKEIALLHELVDEREN